MIKKVKLNEIKPTTISKKVKTKKTIGAGPYTLEFTPSEFNASQTNLGSPILNQLQTEGYKGGDGLDALSLNTFTLQGANFGTSFKTLKNVNANIDIPSVVTGSTYKADWYYLFNIAATGLTINLLIDVLVDGSTATFFNSTGLNATINILSTNGNSTALIPPATFLDITLVTASPYQYTKVYRNEGIQGTLVGEYKLISFAGDILPNFMMCDGRAISRTTYAYYFSLVGTTYGVGDGSTTFNIPNFQGRMGVGYDGSYLLGVPGGSATSSLTSANNGPHTHTTTQDPHSHYGGVWMEDVASVWNGAGLSGGSTKNAGNSGGSGVSGISTDTSITIDVESSGSGTPFSTISPYNPENRLVRVL